MNIQYLYNAKGIRVDQFHRQQSIDLHRRTGIQFNNVIKLLNDNGLFVKKQFNKRMELLPYVSKRISVVARIKQTLSNIGT
jgi:hypothetical protein